MVGKLFSNILIVVVLVALIIVSFLVQIPIEDKWLWGARLVLAGLAIWRVIKLIIPVVIIGTIITALYFVGINQGWFSKLF